MPGLYDPEQVQRLIDTADRLSVELETHKIQLKTTDTRSKNAALGAIFGAFAALAGIVAAVVGISFGIKAQDTADQVKELQVAQVVDTAAARTASCIQFNVQRAEVRAAVSSSLLALVPPGTPLTDAQRVTVERYNKEVESKLPYRDCSAPGLEAYFKNPPADPAIAR